MAKRFGKAFDRERDSPAKRPKLELPKPPVGIVLQNQVEEDDPWGEDFQEEDLVEIDLIASQACSQDVNVSTVDINHREPRNIVKYGNSIQPGPSTSSAAVNGHRTANGTPIRPREASQSPGFKRQKTSNDWRPPASQKLGSSDQIRDVADLPSMDEFKGALMARSNLNSTFQVQSQRPNQATVAGRNVEEQFQHMTGEIIHLKAVVEKVKQNAEKEKLEKEKVCKEQVNNLETSIKTLNKEKENLKTQYDLQTLQLRSLMEKCKLLESNSVKLVQPSTSSVNSPRNKIVRSASVGVRVPRSEISVQVDMNPIIDSGLKTLVHTFPLKDIPSACFEPPQPEKSVVDVKFVEKIGQKNLPILQEEETFRIFENPDLVKPIVSMIDGKQLSTLFFLADFTILMKKTSIDINSKDSLPIINKIVSTTRELLLNSTMVLKKISTAMKNDDIRDMNDLYFSDFYDTQIDYTQSVFSSSPWYKEERGVEMRRALGIISYIAKSSNYLSEYIAGKSILLTEGDEAFQEYSKQMNRYKSWEVKGHEFEMLEMILEFVTTVGLIRRSHQFAGIICAIARMLCNVQERVGFSNRGLKYVWEILKEAVFSRPLLQCFVSLTDLFICFCGTHVFNVKICPSPSEKTAIEIWKGAQYFTPNACVLEVFMAQLMRFKLDEVTTINIAHSILSLIDKAFLLNNVIWPSENNLHNCRINLLTFSITILYNCSKINVDRVKSKLIAMESSGSRSWRKLDDDFWKEIKRKQFSALRCGIRFLSFLTKRDPDFIVRANDVEDIFSLFMQQVAIIKGFTLHENEKEALTLITSTINFDKPSTGESPQKTRKLFTRRKTLGNKRETCRQTENSCENFHKSRVKSIIKTYKSKFQ